MIDQTREGEELNRPVQLITPITTYNARYHGPKYMSGRRF